MKTVLTAAAWLAFVSSQLIAQINSTPEVIITNVTVDEPSQAVYLTYDLLDIEYDPCEVWFGLSLDGGETFLSQNGNVFGDLGPDIQPGTDLQISWFAKDVPDIYQAIVQVVADDGHPVDIQDLLNQVDEQTVYDLMTEVAVKRHHNGSPEGLELVRDSILSVFDKAGLQIEQQEVPYQTYMYPNIIGRQAGWVDEDTTYIVDAHYDGVSVSPGADDNASGVVATLEIARILSQVPCRKSLRYIGFAFEEQGLVGSKEYVSKGGIKPWEEIAGVLNLEMIGYFSNEINSQNIPAGFDILFPEATADINAQLNRGNFLTVVGNEASQPLIDAYLEAADTYVPQLRTVSLAVPGNGQIAPDLRRSDHSRFWDAGYKALMLTDGADTRNKNYHTSKDIVDSLDMPFLVHNIKATLATAAVLAQPMHAGRDEFPLSQLVALDEHNRSFPCTATISPNPVNHTLTLNLGGCNGEDLTATLIDLEGKALLSRGISPVVESELYTFPLGNIQAGTYLLLLETKGSRRSLKVVVE